MLSDCHVSEEKISRIEKSVNEAFGDKPPIAANVIDSKALAANEIRVEKLALESQVGDLTLELNEKNAQLEEKDSVIQEKNNQNLRNDSGDETTNFQRAYLNGRLGGCDITAGRYQLTLVDGYTYNTRFDGVGISYGKDIKIGAFYGKPTELYNDVLKNGDWNYNKLYGATTIGISMPNVPQLVPVANARNIATINIMAGRKLRNPTDNPPTSPATYSLTPRLSVVALSVHANVNMRIAGTIALKPSGIQEKQSLKVSIFLTT